MPGLEVTVRSADRGLDVQFSVAAGEVLAVLGPNGAGKSSVAGVIAGIVGADAAVVRVGDRTVTDSDRGVALPPHARRIGLLSQQPLLFPHLSVLGNVVFAARRSTGSRLAARQAAMSWLETVGAADLASLRPTELSGGQAQRVAIARALAARPEVLVLDEPLAGLDVAGAASVRGVLHRVMTSGGRPAILITHDLLDVLALADRVLVLENGRVAELGPVKSVLAAPRSGFAARIAGINLVRGVLSDTGAVLSAAGPSWHGLPADTADDLPAGGRDADPRNRSGRDAVAVFAPSAVAVFRDQPHGSPRNSVEVRVSGLEVTGASVRVRGEDQPDGAPGLAADITPEAAADLRLEVGDQVWFMVKAHEVRVQSTSQRGTHSSGEHAGRHG